MLAPILVQELRTFRPDVVIAQSPFEGLAVLAARASTRSRAKLVVELHGDWRTAARLYGSPARKAFARLADAGAVAGLRRADGTRAVSSFTAGLAEDVTGEPPLATFTTYNDLVSFLARPVQPLPERPGVAWVGMLQRYKNPETFAAAWPLVAARVPDARLTMVGDGPLRHFADDLVRDFPGGVTAYPRLTPAEVSNVLDESTLLALPSFSEGLPRVAIEAHTRGRPIVGAAAGGIPDIVQHERNGLLVPPADPDRLADAIVRVLSDRELAERLAAGAQADAGRFQGQPDRYADSVADLVDRALAA